MSTTAAALSALLVQAAASTAEAQSTSISFGDDPGGFARDNECDDPRLAREGAHPVENMDTCAPTPRIAGGSARQAATG